MADEVRPDLSTIEVDAVVEVRDAAKRELDVRIMPWNAVIPSVGGTEEFVRGAFDGTEPSSVLLVGLDHERKLALGHNGQPTLIRHPVGRGTALDEREDGAYMTFKVANTQAGDEVLALAADGITRHVSVEFTELPGGTEIQTVKGRRHRRQQRVRLEAVAPTAAVRPAYAGAEILAIRSEHEGDPEVPETTAAPEPVQPDITALGDRFEAAIASLGEHIGSRSEAEEKLVERLESLEERARSTFSIPGDEAETPTVSRGQWMDMALRLLSGERIADAQMRTVADFITTDNAGIVPDTFSSELIGVIDPIRPFCTSTRRLETPATGTTLQVPKITQRPTTGVQSTEKTELSSQKTTITAVSYDMVTIGGVGDLSLQLLKRADRSFLGLYLELLAEAYSVDFDEQAVLALANAAGGFGAATALDPNDLVLGPAFEAAYDNMKRPPDTIWLSTEAVGAFIDAKDDGTNRPLYSNINANFVAGTGPGGLISGLRPVHVPALDTHGCFAIVGPSRGFAWAEDGTYTLQVDVPSKAGRDVALVGMAWYAPMYPDAFTLYNVAS